ncbi:CaiB/BaiF CoA transferase family protein [Cupriavidus oxalaticus]|uniref:CoA transferase n=1 Tax=Cupriavidus oxalaticus TaxID=96344 RepID=A0A375GFB7_9BURK|nr:CaiB/BaiF CoA-transferase family protein [Cupriavidus oxalaticus]QRQ84257.1 CoA transferase [Cupriavidus oxalaticus]QRQ91657.1 CoA transferase [Cupriavidus oxalaticus]WQD86238.1 CaiB/BaiF CoA-transferase family protein [Cupriavidus oxalaticus]SPC05158.1 Predicted acyl-CoA transferase/carnitine dehydratase [Cupriavidus oxalaticus]SPC18075.1 Predicted acyl-CoA transferase/carnitine dehydratase [Cupriavidus oxalaticus]
MGSESTPAAQRLPLSGIRVIEMTHMVMGPACGLVLADLGAEVIKVEPPKGDGTRRLLGAGAGFFRAFNRNKKSISVEVSESKDMQALLKLIDSADVFLENFKPGRMKDLGLDYETLRKRNPRLIYVSHKGFLSGPYEKRLALDEVVQMMAGLAYMTGPAGRPLRAGSSVNDIMGGMFGAIGVLAALHERNATGTGKEIQSGLFENCVLLSAQHMQQYAVTGKPAAPMPARISAWAVYDVFELADSHQMFIAATGDAQWRTLCHIIDRNDLLEDRRLASNNDRVLARDWLLPTLAETLKAFRPEMLTAAFEAGNVPFAEITRPEELFDDPHLKESGGLAKLQVDDGSITEVPLLPLSLDGARLQPRMPIARIGEHTREVLESVGCSASEVDAIVARHCGPDPAQPAAGHMD